MKKLIFSAVLSLISVAALAEVVVSEPWARATVPGQPVGAVYMKISSQAVAKLVDIQSDSAKDVQVHTMHSHDGVMRMREHGHLKVKSGETVELAPGGLHLMLLGLKKPLVAGESVTVKMTFEDAKKVKSTTVVTAPIRAIGK